MSNAAISRKMAQFIKNNCISSQQQTIYKMKLAGRVIRRGRGWQGVEVRPLCTWRGRTRHLVAHVMRARSRWRRERVRVVLGAQPGGGTACVRIALVAHVRAAWGWRRRLVNGPVVSVRPPAARPRIGRAAVALGAYRPRVSDWTRRRVERLSRVARRRGRRARARA